MPPASNLFKARKTVRKSLFYPKPAPAPSCCVSIMLVKGTGTDESRFFCSHQTGYACLSVKARPPPRQAHQPAGQEGLPPGPRPPNPQRSHGSTSSVPQGHCPHETCVLGWKVE